MSAAPSAWVVRWQHLIAHGGNVLDVACGSGRHLGWLQSRGHRMTGVDRSAEALAALAPFAAAGAEIVDADIEDGPWPFEGRTFDAVIVTNYLWRPRLPDIVRALAPGGVLLYETFAAGNESVGRPARADFLLRPGELLATCSGLRVVAYEDGFLDGPARFVQRIAAVALRDAGSGAPAPPRFALDPGRARSGFAQI